MSAQPLLRCPDVERGHYPLFEVVYGRRKAHYAELKLLVHDGIAASPERLIRGLLEVGGLSVATARGVIDAVDSDLPLAHSFGVAQRAVSAKIDPRDVRPEALASIDRLIEGWRVSRDNPGRLAAARVLETFESLGQRDERGWFSRYAAAALLVAEADLDWVEARGSRETMAETVVIGTVLGDALFSGLRRAAQEHVSTLRHPVPSELDPTPTRE